MSRAIKKYETQTQRKRPRELRYSQFFLWLTLGFSSLFPVSLAGELVGIQKTNTYRIPYESFSENLTPSYQKMNKNLQVMESRDPKGNEVRKFYDEETGALTKIEIFNSSNLLTPEKSIHYSYDPKSFRLIAISDDVHALQYTYFKNTELIQSLTYLFKNKKIYSINYDYALHNNLLTHRWDSEENDEKLAYNKWGYLTSYVLNHNQKTKLSYQYTYDTLGRILQVKSSANITTKFHYDDKGNADEIHYNFQNDHPLLEFQYRFNNTHEVLQTTMNFVNPKTGRTHSATTDYSYNDEGELTGFSMSNPDHPSDFFLFSKSRDGRPIIAQKYEYLLNQSLGKVETWVADQNPSDKTPFDTAIYRYDFEHDRTTQLKSVTHSFLPWNTGRTSLKYDENGNLIQDSSGNRYTYDAQNKLIQFQSQNSQSASRSYQYYPTGTLARTTGEPTSVQPPIDFFYSGKNQLIEEMQGVEKAHNSLQKDRITDDTKGGSDLFIALLDGKKNVVGHYSATNHDVPDLNHFQPYGKATNLIKNSDGTSPSHLLQLKKILPSFEGWERDADVPFYFAASQRPYSPTLQMFLNRDTMTPFQGVWNPRSFANGNPIFFQDPSGHSGVFSDIADFFQQRSLVQWSSTLFNFSLAQATLNAGMTLMGLNATTGRLLIASGLMNYLSTGFDLAASLFTTGSTNQTLESASSLLSYGSLLTGFWSGFRYMSEMGLSRVLSEHPNATSYQIGSFLFGTSLGTGIAAHMVTGDKGEYLQYTSIGCGAAALMLTRRTPWPSESPATAPFDPTLKMDETISTYPHESSGSAVGLTPNISQKRRVVVTALDNLTENSSNSIPEGPSSTPKFRGLLYTPHADPMSEEAFDPPKRIGTATPLK